MDQFYCLVFTYSENEIHCSGPEIWAANFYDTYHEKTPDKDPNILQWILRYDSRHR